MIHGPKWVRTGRYTQYAETVDIAPTLAQVLNVRVPSARRQGVDACAGGPLRRFSFLGR